MGGFGRGAGVGWFVGLGGGGPYGGLCGLLWGRSFPEGWPQRGTKMRGPKNGGGAVGLAKGVGWLVGRGGRAVRGIAFGWLCVVRTPMGEREGWCLRGR
jgi:hypothetical protein